MPFARFEDALPFMIPLVIFLIPIIAILTTHQRKMAELIHGNNRNPHSNAEVELLRREVQELKQIVHQQTIAIDGLRSLPSASMADRLTEVQ